MTKLTDELYLTYSQKLKHFADNFAAELTENAKNDVYTLVQSEFKKDLKDATKRERARIKAQTKLFKLKCRAEKKILRSRKSGVSYEEQPTIAEQVYAALDLYFSSPSESPDKDEVLVQGEDTDELVEGPQGVLGEQEEQISASSQQSEDESEESISDTLRRFGIR